LKFFLDRLSSSWLKLGQRNGCVVVIDLFCLAAAVYLGYALRLTFFIAGGYRGEMLGSIALFSISVTCCFAAGKIYRIIWPRASVEEYAKLFRLYCMGVLLYIILLYVFTGYVGPRSSVAILSSLGIIFMGGVRASWRMLLVTNQDTAAAKQRALIIGAGEAGTMLARDIARNDAKLVPIGFIDENPALKGMYLASLKVFGGKEDLPRVLLDENIEVVLIAIPSA